MGRLHDITTRLERDLYARNMPTQAMPDLAWTLGEIERLQADLRNAQISEQHWRDEAQKERDLDTYYETAFNNLCIRAGLDTGRGRDWLEEELGDIVEAAAEAAGRGVMAWICGCKNSYLAESECPRCLRKVIEYLQPIVDKLDKTKDGVPITPDMQLWQVDKRYGITNDGKPWPCGLGWSWQRNSNLPVYSTSAAAEAAGET